MNLNPTIYLFSSLSKIPFLPSDVILLGGGGLKSPCPRGRNAYAKKSEQAPVNPDNLGRDRYLRLFLEEGPTSWKLFLVTKQFPRGWAHFPFDPK